MEDMDEQEPTIRAIVVAFKDGHTGYLYLGSMEWVDEDNAAKLAEVMSKDVHIKTAFVDDVPQRTLLQHVPAQAFSISG